MSVPSETPTRPNRWHPQLYRSSDGVPVLPPEIVSELGRGVLVVDVRERADLTGATGHISGAASIPAAQLSAATKGRPATPGSCSSPGGVVARPRPRSPSRARG